MTNIFGRKIQLLQVSILTSDDSKAIWISYSGNRSCGDSHCQTGGNRPKVSTSGEGSQIPADQGASSASTHPAETAQKTDRTTQRHTRRERG